MKHASIALALVLSLAACSGEDLGIKEQNYIDSVRKDSTQLTQALPDAELLRLGYSACGAMNSGTINDAVAAIAPELNHRSVRVIVVSAIDSLCSQHSRWIEL